MRIQWTQDKINFIVEQYTSQKMNSVQLAKHFGCSNDTILRKLKANGITPHKFYEDLTGKVFGKLRVIGKSDKSDRRLRWICECECGNIIVLKGDTLRQNLQQSCGCINSKTELFIANLLRENNIMFIQQYSFEDLITESGTRLRFDFGIIKNNQLAYLIEYDGEQHFPEKIQSSGWNTKENFEKTQKRDIIKNRYCVNHNIPLIRIPYTHKANIKIEDLLLESSAFIIQKEG